MTDRAAYIGPERRVKPAHDPRCETRHTRPWSEDRLLAKVGEGGSVCFCEKLVASQS
jgi:hypothetical protein